jgi:hypothetical protein
MVFNPIYDQGPIPLYDTIPTTPSKTVKDSEMNAASSVSGFKTSSSTFKAANSYYMDESLHSPLQRNFSGNIRNPNVRFNREDDVASDGVTVPSLECVKKFSADAETGEETYILMLPGNTVANSKS